MNLTPAQQQTHDAISANPGIHRAALLRLLKPQATASDEVTHNRRVSRLVELGLVYEAPGAHSKPLYVVPQGSFLRLLLRVEIPFTEIDPKDFADWQSLGLIAQLPSSDWACPVPIAWLSAHLQAHGRPDLLKQLNDFKQLLSIVRG